jgi:hypothetical protein
MSGFMTGMFTQQYSLAKKMKYAQGGVLRGKSHAQGGINLGSNDEAEGGEIILSKGVSKNPSLYNKKKRPDLVKARLNELLKRIEN